MKENPWERVRLVRRRITRTPLVYSLRAKNDIGFHIVPLDVSLLRIERFIANGLQRFRTVDPLQDMDNIVPLLNYGCPGAPGFAPACNAGGAVPF